jgi:RNase P/RNase MRP subunit p30
LKVDVNNFEEIENKLQFCENLRIKNVVLESKNSNLKFNLKLKSKIRKCSQINIFFRNNLKPNNLNDFKKEISKYSNTNEIISIETIDKQIQIQAAKDSRVDIISFSSFDVLNTISPGVISLTTQNNSFIEFSLAPLIEVNKTLQSKNLRNLYRGIHLAMDLRANYIISGNFDNVFDIRHPRGLISVCYTLLGMSILDAKKGFLDNVKSLIKKVNDRQNNGVIESGVELIKNGVR